jgi:WD40 repeat protein
MTETRNCPECGALLPAKGPKGLCNQCAMDRALAMTHGNSLVQSVEVPSPAAGPQPLRFGEDIPLGSFGEYELLEEIARGGMGVVYKARQRNLDRIVAVKMILAGPLAGKDFVQRFRTESAAAAILQHPNIVAIHDVGVHEGRHYFSMDYVEGQSLAQLVGQQPLAPARAARYVEILAGAIHYAHERGILHRDLKPSNVLIDHGNDQPRITDFGLARRLDGNSSLTMTGQVLGSPNFMPPEQAGAKRGKVGAPSDVYALGGILYYLLTARAPFQADSLEHLITQVLHAEPVAPRLLNPSVPRDLETITLKCLEKEPSRRYQTAQELADELGRVLRHEPIRARPITQPEKLWRWGCRNPALATALGFALAALVIGLATTSWQWRRAEGMAGKERHERERAVTGESNLVHQLYVADMKLIQAAWEQNNLGRVRHLLGKTANAPERGFEWYYWQRQLHLELKTLRGHAGPILGVAYSPDGQRIVTGSADHTAKVWDAATGTYLFPLIGHANAVRSLAYSPDGKWIVTGSWDNTAKVWDAKTGTYLRTLIGHTNAIFSVAFSRDSQRIVTGSRDGTAKVWNANTGIPIRTLEGHGGVVWSATFSFDGSRIVTGHWDSTAIVWSATDGSRLRTLSGHEGAILSVAFSPDDRRILTGSRDSTAKVWDARTGEPLFTLYGHTGRIFCAIFSPDGQRIVTAGDDQTARIWDGVHSHEPLAVKKHGSRISSVAFSPDGQHIVTAGGSINFSPEGKVIIIGNGDRLAKVWEVTTEREVLTLKEHTDAVSSVAFSPDGQWVVTASFDESAKAWDSRTGTELFTLPHTSPVRSAAFSPDGSRIVTGSFDYAGNVWEIASRQKLFSLIEHRAPVTSVTYSPDGERILTSSEDGTAIVWNAATGQKLVPLTRPYWLWLWFAAFSPDGRRVVTANQGGDEDATVWDTDTGNFLLALKGRDSWTFCAAFSPDGRRIVTAHNDGTAKVWDASSRNLLLTLEGHSGGVMSAIFSPDGRRILTSSHDQTAKVWDAATGEELLTLKGHKEWVISAVFSPDGLRIATASFDKTAKLWEAASTEQAAAWQKQDASAAAAEQSVRSASVNLPGAITNWLVLLPIGVEGKNGARALQEEQVANESQLRPHAQDRIKVGAQELVWREVRLKDCVLDFNRLMGETTEWSVAYAVCYIQCDSAHSGVWLKIGSDDQARVYLNGKLIHEATGRRMYQADEDTVEGVAFEAGLNVLVFKVVNESQGWQGSVRFTDAAGQPISGIRLTLTPP